MATDFQKITPCGGCCDDCEHKKSGACRGCREVSGQCVKLWSDGCQIYRCCQQHGAHFCGVCEEFPCPWIEGKIAEWDKDGIQKLARLGQEYRGQSAWHK